MYSYKDQLDVIKKVKVQDGQTFRGNCPFCGGRNTFTITRQGEAKVWNCYRVSCGVTGSIGGLDSLAGIKRRLLNLNNGYENHESFPPIPFLTPVESQPKAIEWLDKVHSLEAYSQNLIQIRYAPSEDRIMFGVSDFGLSSDPNVVGWTGRARQGTKPRWRKYGNCRNLLMVGKDLHGDRINPHTAVLVEDACSACAVGILDGYAGCSLLGTSLSRVHLMGLRGFSKVLVCLDPDASQKGLKMVENIQGTVPCYLRLIPEDLKNMSKNDIMKVLINAT